MNPTCRKKEGEEVIELPESHRLARQLNETILGKTIMNVYAQTTPHKFAWYFGDPEAYHDRLTGKTVGGAKALGGLLEIQAGDMRVVLGDGVNVRYFSPEQPVPPRHQLHIEFDDFSSLVCSVQMYGGLWAFRAGENDNPYYLVAQAKPDPLSDAFDRAYFDTLYTPADEKLSLKAFLATKQRIPGLGNGVLQDILFQAGLHPRSKMSALAKTDFDALYLAIKGTLASMTAGGGRDTERDLFGCSGNYQTVLSGKNKGKPCRVCQMPIVQEAYLGGNIYTCPVCQILKK